MAKSKIKNLNITINSPLDVPVFDKLNRVAKFLGISPTSTARMLLIQKLDEVLAERGITLDKTQPASG